MAPMILCRIVTLGLLSTRATGLSSTEVVQSWRRRSTILPIASGYATCAGPDMKGNKPHSKNKYPYPKHANPTPHQIFHLPFGASREQIKVRYYELVRAYHPDSSDMANVTPEITLARFRSIKAAYDFLCGRTLSPHPNARPTPSPQTFDPHLHELARRRRAFYASRGRYRMDDDDPFGSETWAKPGWANGFGAPKEQQAQWKEDGWRERLILTFGVVVLLAGLFPGLPFTIASLMTPVTCSPNYLPGSQGSSRGSESSTKGSLPNSSSSAPSTTFPSNIFPDLDKSHRAAVSALVEARQERQEVGAARREGVRQRAREINAAADPPSSKYQDTPRP